MLETLLIKFLITISINVVSWVIAHHLDFTKSIAESIKRCHNRPIRLLMAATFFMVLPYLLIGSTMCYWFHSSLDFLKDIWKVDETN